MGLIKENFMEKSAPQDKNTITVRYNHRDVTLKIRKESLKGFFAGNAVGSYALIILKIILMKLILKMIGLIK